MKSKTGMNVSCETKRSSSHASLLERISIALIIVGCLVTLLAVPLMHERDISRAISLPRSTMTIVTGDTLYDIASENRIKGLDTNETIDVIRDINGINCDLFVGQKISVPIDDFSS